MGGTGTMRGSGGGRNAVVLAFSHRSGVVLRDASTASHSCVGGAWKRRGQMGERAERHRAEAKRAHLLEGLQRRQLGPVAAQHHGERGPHDVEHAGVAGAGGEGAFSEHAGEITQGRKLRVQKSAWQLSALCKRMTAASAHCLSGHPPPRSARWASAAS
jgi:hypothetical protein